MTVTTMETSAYSKVKSELAESVRKAAESAGYKTDNVESSIDFSRSFGDISCSISFRIGKENKKDPNAVAKEISSKMQKANHVEKITVEGSFINFYLERKSFAALVLERKTDHALERGTKSRVIIEYVSVNPNKPWHIGHLRNALLGDSISNAYSALGYDVERENYIDDLGLQMAETTWWYLNRNNKPTGKFDHWLGEEYVKVNDQLEDPEVKAGIAKVLELIGQDGTYEAKMEREIAIGCVMAQHATATAYSVFQDLMVWESDIVKENLLEKAFLLLKNYGFITVPKTGDYANCTIIDLTKIKDLPKEFDGLKEDAKVLIRSNGTPTYIAKDIAFHMWKLGIIENTFKYSVFMEKQVNGKPLYTTGPEGKKMDFAGANIAVNIIDARQSHPQSIIRLVFRAMGKIKESDNIKHLAYGEVELESGALSGRKGTWLGYSADDLLREAETKAQGLISSRFKFGKDEEKKVIKSAALAAIKFEFLKIGPERKIVFSWDKALNFEGNSGPYAQYMHARATRIIDEAPRELTNRKANVKSINDSEFMLVKLLSKQTDVVTKAAHELRPNVITEYINELGHAFATFYENSPILKAESDEEKVFRISITLSFKNAIKHMLDLLGIDALERM